MVNCEDGACSRILARSKPCLQYICWVSASLDEFDKFPKRVQLALNSRIHLVRNLSQFTIANVPRVKKQCFVGCTNKLDLFSMKQVEYLFYRFTRIDSKSAYGGRRRSILGCGIEPFKIRRALWAAWLKTLQAPRFYRGPARRWHQSSGRRKRAHIHHPDLETHSRD